MNRSFVGFRVKTGWAAVVLVSRVSKAPVVVDVRKVQLSDPAEPYSRFPFHAGLDLPKAQGRKKTAGLVKVVRRYSKHSLARLLKDYEKLGGRLIGAAVVVGSETDPATIANDHFRAHAEEGRLFRSVIVEAVTRMGLPIRVLLERDLFAKASARLGRSTAQLKKDLMGLGERVEGSWRSEEKGAALAALAAMN